MVKGVRKALAVPLGEGIRVHAAASAGLPELGGADGIVGALGRDAGHPVDLTGGGIREPVLLPGRRLSGFIGHTPFLRSGPPERTGLSSV